MRASLVRFGCDGGLWGGSWAAACPYLGRACHRAFVRLVVRVASFGRERTGRGRRCHQRGHAMMRRLRRWTLLAGSSTGRAALRHRERCAARTGKQFLPSERSCAPFETEICSSFSLHHLELKNTLLCTWVFPNASHLFSRCYRRELHIFVHCCFRVVARWCERVGGSGGADVGG